MMNEKLNDISAQKNQFEMDLDTIKRKFKKSEHKEFVQVRLTEETKKELVAFCEQEEIYVSTLLREMVESYLKQIKK